MSKYDGEVLIGKTLTGVEISKDREKILFRTTEGNMVVHVEGDCCSQSWVEGVELTVLSFPAIVTEVVNLELGETSGGTPHRPAMHHECDPEYSNIAYYGLEIRTDKGAITFDYRNDSNGYYGANLDWPWERTKWDNTTHTPFTSEEELEKYGFA